MLISRIMPWNTATGTNVLSLAALNIDGRQTSIEFIPAMEIAAKQLPFLVKYLQPNNAKSSLTTFVNNAIVASWVA